MKLDSIIECKRRSYCIEMDKEVKDCIYCCLGRGNNGKNMSCFEYCQNFPEEAEKKMKEQFLAYSAKENVESARIDFCKLNGSNCEECPISSENNGCLWNNGVGKTCNRYCQEYPVEAYEKMGVILSDKENDEKQFLNRKEILEEAANLITGERETEYGRPEENFHNICEFWRLYLYAINPWLKDEKERCFKLDEKDVAIMMALLKIARQVRGGTNDTYADLAGYAALAGELSAIRLGSDQKQENDAVEIANEDSEE